MPINEETLLGYTKYVTNLFADEDEALRETRAEIEREKMPIIHVSPSQGKLLNLIARLVAPKRILELGTLGGYSAIWLARALPENGKLISLELDPHHAEVSVRNIERAGLGAKVEVRVGPAAETLRQMRSAGEESFDLVFIDADKPGYPEYLDICAPMVRSGGVILADNALQGDVLDPNADTGITRYNKAAAAHPDFDSTLFPVLRERDIDGVLMSIKK
jgi:predicted O-methyltransferase YrrM